MAKRIGCHDNSKKGGTGHTEPRHSHRTRTIGHILLLVRNHISLCSSLQGWCPAGRLEPTPCSECLTPITCVTSLSGPTKESSTGENQTWGWKKIIQSGNAVVSLLCHNAMSAAEGRHTHQSSVVGCIRPRERRATQHETHLLRAY